MANVVHFTELNKLHLGFHCEAPQILELEELRVGLKAQDHPPRAGFIRDEEANREKESERKS
jgi:hypothetical protein